MDTETRREDHGIPLLIEEGMTTVARNDVISPTSTILHKIDTPLINLERQRNGMHAVSKSNEPQSTTRSQNLVKSPHNDSIELQERKNAS